MDGLIFYEKNKSIIDGTIAPVLVNFTNLNTSEVLSLYMTSPDGYWTVGYDKLSKGWSNGNVVMINASLGCGYDETMETINTKWCGRPTCDSQRADDLFLDVSPPEVEAEPVETSSPLFNISVGTDEQAYCGWGFLPDDYQSMENQFEEGEGTLSHSTPISIWRSPSTIYISCSDGCNHMMDSFPLPITLYHSIYGLVKDEEGEILDNVSIQVKNLDTSEAISFSSPGEWEMNLSLLEKGWEDGDLLLINASRGCAWNEIQQEINLSWCGSPPCGPQPVSDILLDVSPPEMVLFSPEEKLNNSSVFVDLWTDEQAYCRWGQKEESYDSMENQFSSGEGTKNHTTWISAREGENTYYLSCSDGCSFSLLNLSFFVDSLPPEIISSGPSGFVVGRDVSLRVTTDENASCRYSQADKDYLYMSNFSITGAKEHSTGVQAVCGENTFFVRCMDELQNRMDESRIIKFRRVCGRITPTPTPSPTPVEKINDTEIRENETEFSFPEFGIWVRIEVRNVSLVNISISEVVPEIEAPPVVYKYFQLEIKNATEIKNLTIGFEVDKAWIEKNRIDENSILLYKYNISWVPLPTSLVNKTPDFLYFESEVKKLSLFAITGKEEVEEVEEVKEKKISVREEIEEIPETPEPEQDRYLPYEIFVVILLIIFLVFFLVLIFKKRAS
jgi:hypothetical protein